MRPRLFGIPATDAPVIAVIRRGPSDWCHVGRWDTAALTYEAGSWIHGVLYPQRCDLSPDGRWLSYFVLKSGAQWAPGATYHAISRLPWLAALAAWGTDGTWTRGLSFVPRGTAAFPPGPPEIGDLRPLLEEVDLEHRRPASYAVERSRGWRETPGSAAASPADPWDEHRAVQLTMEKPRPVGDGFRLVVSGWYATHRSGEPGRGPARYGLVTLNGDDVALPGVQWADWAQDGRLLVATGAGELEVRPDPRSREASWRLDLAELTPDPTPPPPEAAAW